MELTVQTGVSGPPSRHIEGTGVWRTAIAVSKKALSLLTPESMSSASNHKAMASHHVSL